MRRGCTEAGTKGLVMRMWSVPDRETNEMMLGFYKNALSGKINRCQALRQAALKQMQVVRQKYGHTNPFYSTGFRSDGIF